MSFTGLDIFPGLQAFGLVPGAVTELATEFNLAALNALSMVPERKLEWADKICGVTPAILKAKVPIDFTALDGFESFDGETHFKQVDLTAIEIKTSPWRRALEWDVRLSDGVAQLSGVYSAASKAPAFIRAARVMKARLAASILMQGTPGTDKARTVPQPGAPNGLSLFNTSHYSNPLDPNSRQFSNYHAAAGKFSTAFAQMRTDMQKVPSPVSSVETLGLEVTTIIIPTFMEEAVRAVYLQNLAMQTASIGGTGVAAATSNIYIAGTTPWDYYVSPALDQDPYVAANVGKHMWIAVSQTIQEAHPIELAAANNFLPEIQIFGPGTEMSKLSRKMRIIADLDAGAAAGVYHTIARYEET